MNKKDFLESQKECAKMLGMTLKQYEEYLKNTKINDSINSKIETETDNDNYSLQFFNLKKNQLKLRKDDN